MTKIDLSQAAKAQITCKRGDTFQLESMRFWTDANKTIPLDITGFDFEMDVKNRAGELIVAFTSADFVISDTNRLDVIKSSSGMLVPASPLGQPYQYDLEMTDLSGVISTILYGDFIIEQDITNA
jgi:hypothetical protein